MQFSSMHVCFLFITLWFHCLSTSKAAGFRAPLFSTLFPIPEDPKIFITVADLLNQGSSSGTGYNGFQLDTERQVSSLIGKDCSNPSLNPAALRPTTLTLYKKQQTAKVKVDMNCFASDSTPYYSEAALGPAMSALPRQLSKGGHATFAYCLPPLAGNGSIFFGATSYFAKNKRIQLVKIPMKISSDHDFYRVQLTGLEMSGVKREFHARTLAVSARDSFSTFPTAFFKFLKASIFQSLKKRNIVEAYTEANDPRPPTYAITHCFRMSSAEVSASPKLKMVLSYKYTWVVTPQNYFIRMGQDNVYCFTFLEASAQEMPAIGTALQQGRVVEFDLKKKTLGISKLLAHYGTTCQYTL